MPESGQPERIFDVDESTFQARVVEASRERPVVVDFWAPWCAPCRVLTPVLEKVVGSHQGRCALAKVNVDANQSLAAAFGVRGIPAVKVFRDGKVVAEFVGAQPESEVARLLARIVPSPGDETAQEAARLLEAGRTEEAEKRLREVLAADEKHAAAAVGLAHLALERGDCDEARRLASLVEPGTPESAQAQAVLARLAFIDHCREAGGREAVEQRLAADETDIDAWYDLASCLAADGDYPAALDRFLAVVAADKTFRDGAAKDAMVSIFSIIGQRSPLADDYRARLAQVLY